MPDAEMKTLKTSNLFATNMYLVIQANMYLVTHAQTRNASTEEVSVINENLQFRKDYIETPTGPC